MSEKLTRLSAIPRFQPRVQKENIGPKSGTENKQSTISSYGQSGHQPNSGLQKPKPLLQGPFRPSIVANKIKLGHGLVAPKIVHHPTRKKSSTSSDTSESPEKKSKPRTRKKSESSATGKGKSHVSDTVMIEKLTQMELRLTQEKEKVTQLEETLSSMKVNDHISYKDDLEESNCLLQEKNISLQENLRDSRTALEKYSIDPISCKEIMLDTEKINEQTIKATEDAILLKSQLEEILSENQGHISELQELLEA